MTNGLTKKHSIKKDAVYVYAAHFLKYLGPLVLIPYYSRVLGPEGYGQVLAALSLMTMINVIVNFGFWFSGIREVASVHGAEKYGEVLGRQILGRALMVPIGIVAGVLGTYFSPLLRDNCWFGVLATLLGILTAFGLSWFFQGLRQFKKSIVFETIIYPMNIIFILLLVRGPEDGLLALVGLLLSNSLSLGISYIYVRREALPKFPSLMVGLREIRDTSLFFVTSMSFTVLTIGSTYILSIMASPHEVGYYGTAERFISVAIALLTPISQVLMPSITHHRKEDPERADSLMRKGLLLETSYGLTALAGGALLAPFVIPLFLGSSFLPTVGIFQAMLAVLPFVAIKHAIVLYVLIPRHKDKHYLSVALFNVIVNLAVALALVPTMGAIGMAYARCAAEISATVLLFVLLWRTGLLKALWPVGNRPRAAISDSSGD